MKAMNISGNKRPPAQGSGRKELQEHRGIGNEEPMCRKCRNVSDQGLFPLRIQSAAVLAFSFAWRTIVFVGSPDSCRGKGMVRSLAGDGSDLVVVLLHRDAVRLLEAATPWPARWRGCSLSFSLPSACFSERTRRIRSATPRRTRCVPAATIAAERAPRPPRGTPACAPTPESACSWLARS